MRTLNAKWAAKLLRTKNFVVLTDTESALNFKGMDPKKIVDRHILLSQYASLKGFDRGLHALIKLHDQAVQKLYGKGADAKTNPSKRKKIPVKD